MGNKRAAEEAYRKAIQLKPDFAEVYTHLSPLLKESGRTSEAEAVLRQGVEHCPKAPRIHSYLGQLLTELRRNSEALQQFRLAVDIMPSYSEARVGMAAQQRIASRNDSGLLGEAIRNNSLAIEFDPDNESAYFGLGLCYRDRGDWKNAESSFREAIRCDDHMGASWFYRAVALRHLGADSEEILASLRNAESNGHKRLYVKLECAKVFAAGGYTADALAALRDAAKANGGTLPRKLVVDPAFTVIRKHNEFLQLTTSG